MQTSALISGARSPRLTEPLWSRSTNLKKTLTLHRYAASFPPRGPFFPLGNYLEEGFFSLLRSKLSIAS